MISNDDKNKFLDELRKTSIVTSACNKTGISRATIYRWIKKDPSFRELVDEAKSMGIEVMCDAAELVIFSGIKDKKFQSARYYLEHHSKRYMTRMTKQMHDEELRASKKDNAHKKLEDMETLKLFHDKYGDIDFGKWFESNKKNDSKAPEDPSD